jgi:hypothetical protein
VYGCACVPLRGNPPGLIEHCDPPWHTATIHSSLDGSQVVSNSPGPRIKAHTSNLSTKSVAVVWSLALVALVPGRARDDEPIRLTLAPYRPTYIPTYYLHTPRPPRVWSYHTNRTIPFHSIPRYLYHRPRHDTTRHEQYTTLPTTSLRHHLHHARHLAPSPAPSHPPHVRCRAKHHHRNNHHHSRRHQQQLC